MPKSAPKSRKTISTPGAGAATIAPPATRGPGRPPRPRSHARKQIVVDTALLAEAMRLTGRGQSETVNEALARMTENAGIVEGIRSLLGAFPDFPNHSEPLPDDIRDR